MREFIPWPATAEQAKAQCPWAVVIAAYKGGYVCFESWHDYQKWWNGR